MRTRSLAVAVIATAALLAGCDGAVGAVTGGNPSPSPSRASHQDEADALLAVSRCMRTNGYPSFPDPVQRDDGHWEWPAESSGMPRGRVSTPCDDLVRTAKSKIRGSQRDDKLSQAELAKLREYAACMRRQGIADWPDPVGDGSFDVPQRLQPPSNDPRFRDASKTCEQQAGVSGGIRITEDGA